MSYHGDIIQAAQRNATFRTVLSTAANVQLVVMSLLPGEDIGLETHTLDQVLVIVAGRGTVDLDGQQQQVAPGSLILVSAGTRHNLTNTGQSDMKLYTLYAPPEHPDGTVHATKADAVASEHHS